MELLGLLVIGFFIGITHAMEADHLAAVASVNQHGRGLRSLLHRGVVWGIGHGIALLLICGIVILASISFDKRVEAWLELTVAAMIISLGLNTIYRLAVRKVHFHVHQHDGHKHLHAHSHQAEPAPIPHSQLAHQHKHPKRGHWLALLIGLLHGAAGSGGLLVLVVAATHSIFEAFIYILVFAVGAIVGMALLSIVVSMPLSLAQAGAGRVNKIALTALAGFCFWTGGQLGFSSLTILGFINS